jgi:hypothetical protein
MSKYIEVIFCSPCSSWVYVDEHLFSLPFKVQFLIAGTKGFNRRPVDPADDHWSQLRGKLQRRAKV